jgi:hypothetical protein
MFLLLYGIMYALTKRDPWWPEVWRDYLLLWMALHPFQAMLLRNAVFALILAAIGMILFW